eukprot:CAMPEP_0177647732 /NCGR_PEP_ID=MMETSP0447-20121125/10457_1 /TAXON_ID=0 /ORGANISM="Stygamoeba regulata, Strain BSH-02190019" /LENGTH=380 /DNA_ID=CAMNT_0019150337 /DNA_START=28 /DNA_END=1170 /DNA_ORIENTATION=+
MGTSSAVLDAESRELNDLADSDIEEEEDKNATLKDDEVLAWSNNCLGRFRHRMWIFWEDPLSSKPALFVTIFYMGLILTSVMSFIIETSPEFYSEDEDKSSPFYILEAVIVGFFTVEYLLRFFACPYKLRFLIAPMNIIDLLAILPFYLTLMIGSGISGIAVIRVIRLTRVLRLLKLGKHSAGAMMFIKAIQRGKRGLFMLVFMVTFGVIIFSSIEYYAETASCTFSEADDTWYYDDGDATPFQSIPHSMWWAIVTMTTVGYGDVYPITGAGYAFGAITALCGIVIVSFPVAMLSAAFLAEYQAAKGSADRRQKKQRARCLSNFEEFHQAADELELTLVKGLDASSKTARKASRLSQAFFLFVPKYLNSNQPGYTSQLDY